MKDEPIVDPNMHFHRLDPPLGRKIDLNDVTAVKELIHTTNEVLKEPLLETCFDIIAKSECIIFYLNLSNEGIYFEANISTEFKNAMYSTQNIVTVVIKSRFPKLWNTVMPKSTVFSSSVHFECNVLYSKTSETQPAEIQAPTEQSDWDIVSFAFPCKIEGEMCINLYLADNDRRQHVSASPCKYSIVFVAAAYNSTPSNNLF